MHVLIYYKLLCVTINVLRLLQLPNVKLCVNERHERNIPEVMRNQSKERLSVSQCTITLRIARVHRARSQVSTFFSTCMTLLQIALEGCHRQEELFQAAWAVSQDFHKGFVPTNGSEKDIVEGRTVIYYISLRVRE